MRRLSAVAAASFFLASCGGDEAAPPPTTPATPSSQGARPAMTDGRLGGAFAARPGRERVLDRGGRRPAASVAKPRRDLGGVSAEAACADGDLLPTAENVDRVSSVVLCFMNAMRANDGRAPLTENAQLEEASLRHSRDMVARGFFAHDTPDGVDVVARLREAGYVPREGTWVVGENLAWGSGVLATPRAIVQAWMDSPAHRDNLLSADYREVGLGIVPGSPVPGRDGGATFTTDFGTRVAGSSASAVPSARRKCRRKRGRARTRCIRTARRAAARR